MNAACSHQKTQSVKCLVAHTVWLCGARTTTARCCWMHKSTACVCCAGGRPARSSRARCNLCAHQSRIWPKFSRTILTASPLKRLRLQFGASLSACTDSATCTSSMNVRYSTGLSRSGTTHCRHGIGYLAAPLNFLCARAETRGWGISMCTSLANTGAWHIFMHAEHPRLLLRRNILLVCLTMRLCQPHHLQRPPRAFRHPLHPLIRPFVHGSMIICNCSEIHTLFHRMKGI